MTNEQYLNIENIINRVVSGYKTPLVCSDDLKQICCENILLHENNYDATKGMKYETYIHQLCKWAIDKELDNIKRKEEAVESFISLSSPVVDTEGSTTVEDAIADIKTDIEETVNNKLMASYYYNIINTTLSPCEAMTLILRAFYGFDYKTIIEQVPSIANNNQVSSTLNKARTNLIRRSAIMRAEWEQLVGYNEYKTERVAICNSV